MACGTSDVFGGGHIFRQMEGCKQVCSFFVNPDIGQVYVIFEGFAGHARCICAYWAFFVYWADICVVGVCTQGPFLW